jgi:hypothetical protein
MELNLEGLVEEIVVTGVPDAVFFEKIPIVACLLFVIMILC